MRARPQAGRGWLEFAVSAVLLSVLTALLLQALLRQQEIAERTAVEMTVMNMRSGLRYRIAELILADRTAEIAALAGANPVGWLARPPEGYLGETDAAELLLAQSPGTWRFDTARRELVYRVNRGEGFSSLDAGSKEIRLQVVSERGSLRHGALLGMSIVVANRYEWK